MTLTYDECMARLRAVEPLPVGERLARFFDSSGPGKRVAFKRNWVVLYGIMESNRVPGHYRLRARPLRIARERARHERMRGDVFLRARNAAQDENARLRAALEEALDKIERGWVFEYDDLERIRAIAEGKVKP